MLVLASLVATVPVAMAQEDDARAALTQAIRLYLAGDAAGARDSLQALLARGPSLDAGVRRESLVWLGDVLYGEGGPAAARNSFETVLAEAPDYPIDHVAHSAEVVAFFEEVRAANAPHTPPPPVAPAPRGPWPWKTLLPGGASYFLQGDPVPGAIVGGLQIAGLGVSFGTWLELQRRLPADHTLPEGDEQGLAEFKTLVWINRATATVGCVAYVLPIAIETGNWGARRPVSVAVGPNTVTFSGSF
jgi:hypothetical protein